MILRIIPILLVYLIIHYYFYVRLVREPDLPNSTRRVAGWVLASVASLALVGMLSGRLFGATESGVVLASSFWMGFGLYLFVGLLIAEALRLVVRMIPVHRRPRFLVGNPSPRRLNRMLAIMVITFAACLSTCGFYNARQGPQVKPVNVELEGLPAQMDGLRIALISDLHVGQTIGVDYVTRVAQRVARAEPDLIALTGDLVDGRPAELGEKLGPLLSLRPPLGMYFVPGNHDHYSGLAPWLRYLESNGVRVLLNERTSISRNGASIDLAGIDDPRGQPNLPEALAGRDPNKFLLLLAHRPRAVYAAAQSDVDLMLCGHTHGGQLFPGPFIAPILFPYVAGLHNHQGTRIYVSRGAGYVGPPLRLMAPSEITLVTLQQMTNRGTDSATNR